MKKTMKHKMEKWMMLVLLLTAALTGLTACSDVAPESGEETAVAVIVGVHQNFPAMDANSETIKEAVLASTTTRGEVYIIKCDGEPKVVYQTNLKPLSEGYSSSKKRKIAEEDAMTLLNYLSTDLKPEAEEVDFIRALKLAAECLEGSPCGRKILAICDSGISTSGVLDFTSGMLDYDVDDILSALDAAKEIYNMQGVEVYWTGFCETCGEQVEVPSIYEEKFEELYDTYFQEAGVKSIQFTKQHVYDMAEDYNTYPDVSEIEFPDHHIIVLSEETLAFRPDSDEFLDERDAESTVDEAIMQITSSGRTEVKVVGTTAKYGSREHCKALSEKRAQRVAEILLDKGVVVTCVEGLGYDSEYYISDQDGEGKLIEEFAKLNRAVRIIF